MNRHFRIFVVLAFIAGCTANSGQAAGIQLVDIFTNTSFTQSSGAAPTTPSGYFADVELTSQTAGDFTNVSVSYPGPGSPTSLPNVSPTFFSYGPSFPTLAAMSGAIPFGTYNFTATNSVTSLTQTAALSYTTNIFANNTPALSAASFNALSGLNPASALTINFNSFTPSPAASQGFTFFSIFGSGGTVFTDGFLAPGSTSLIIPAGTLAAGTTYTFELDFSDRLNGTDPVNGVATLIGSDLRTDGTFTTGAAASTVPEPGTLLVAGSALLVLALRPNRFRLANVQRSSSRN